MKKDSSNLGATVGGVIGGLVVLALIIIGGLWIRRRSRLKEQRSFISMAGSAGGAGAEAAESFSFNVGGGGQGAQPELLGGTAIGGRLSSLALGTSGDVLAPSSSVYMASGPRLPGNYYGGPVAEVYDTAQPEMQMAFAPVHSHIERAPPTVPPRNSDAFMRSLYPAGVSPYTSSVSQSAQPAPSSSYQPLAIPDEDVAPVPPPSNTTVLQAPTTGSDGVMSQPSHSNPINLRPEQHIGYMGSDIEGWRSITGSTAPPSYRTERD